MKNNAHQHSFVSNNSANPPPVAQPGFTATAVALSGKSSGKMGIWTSLRELGRQRALTSGALEARADDIKALTDLALAAAREVRCEPYNPKSNPGDAKREAEYKRTLIERDDADLALKHALADARDAEREVARTQNGPAPFAPWWQLACGAGLIGATSAPTLHDVLAGLDPASSWLASLTVAGGAGAFIAWTSAGRTAVMGKSLAKWVGVGSGIALGVGLGLIRLAAATAWDEVGVAAGMTVIEIGAVVILERVGASLRHRYAEWIVRENQHLEALAQFSAANDNVARRRKRLDEIEAKLQEHIEYVEDRTARSGSLKELEQAALRATLDGYNSGIAENRGRVLGVQGGVR